MLLIRTRGGGSFNSAAMDGQSDEAISPHIPFSDWGYSQLRRGVAVGPLSIDRKVGTLAGDKPPGFSLLEGT